MTQFVGRMNMDSESLMKLEAISPTSEAVIVTRRGSWPILELKKTASLFVPAALASLARKMSKGDWQVEWCVHMNDIWDVCEEFNGLGATFNIYLDADGYRHMEFEVSCNV